MSPGFHWQRSSLTDHHLRAVWLSSPWNRADHRTFCYGENLGRLQQMQGVQLCLFFSVQLAAGNCEPVRRYHFSFLALVGETATTKFHRTIFWQSWQVTDVWFKLILQGYHVLVGFTWFVQFEWPVGTPRNWYVCWDQLEPVGASQQILIEPQQGFESWEGYQDYIEESFKTFGDKVPRNLGNLGCLSNRFQDVNVRIDSQKACASCLDFSPM